MTIRLTVAIFISSILFVIPQLVFAQITLTNPTNGSSSTEINIGVTFDEACTGPTLSFTGGSNPELGLVDFTAGTYSFSIPPSDPVDAPEVNTSNVGSITPNTYDLQLVSFSCTSGFVSSNSITAFELLADTAPSIVSLSPADDAIDIAPSDASGDVVLEIEFDETVFINAGSVDIRRASDDVLHEEIDVESVAVTGDGTTTIEIVGNQELDMGTEYYIDIDSSAFLDSGGNQFTDLDPFTHDGTLWNFTTGTFTSPQINTPASSSSGNVIDIDIDINEATEPGSMILSMESSGNPTIELTLNDLVVGNHTFTVDPADPASVAEVTSSSVATIPDDTYDVVITHTELDSGYVMSDAITLFQLETTTPSIINLDPEHEAIDVAIDANLVMTFDEALGAETGSIFIKKLSDNSIVEEIDVAAGPQLTGNGTDTITLDLLDDLAYDTAYYVEIETTALRDLFGNYFDGITNSTTWNFTTLANPNPPSSSRSSGGTRYGCKDPDAENYTRFASHKQSLCEYDSKISQTTTPESLEINNTLRSSDTLLDSGLCTDELTVTDNMRFGNRDGQYSNYNNDTVTQVALLQSHINRILQNRYDQAAGPVDGIFGPLTKQGVQRIQSTLRDEFNAILGPTGVDGVVGPFTRVAINNSCGKN